MTDSQSIARELKLPAAFEILRNNQELNRLADTKVSFLLIVHGMIVSSVINYLSSRVASNSSLTDSMTLFSTLLLASVGVAIAWVFLVILARSGSDSSRAPRASRSMIPSAGFVYFGHIASMEMEAYIKTATRMDTAAILSDVLRQTHEVSSIGKRKYHCLGRAFGWSIVAFLLWGLWIGALLAEL
ncbi:MAG: hypothetical protein CVV64_10780 [Candidatus Wallbacteria bacterium HGW-Wallbacteria-1]|jgi:hypothetical protein|uniref:Pycsar effector protein domain-containing protein n=1 Tax=Candidatus Wallbacteria bacterium HGW-Wallbacteria-1 TaxID=2013854 RepID=A0A2N1PPE4_9BACT|nr:MAG: hypothetical protein CVV64_10780 [Candidatus Wallbacteria bacterium HGW-Wallbacteria-1]